MRIEKKENIMKNKFKNITIEERLENAIEKKRKRKI